MEINSDEIILSEFKHFKHASIYWLEQYPDIAMIRANTTYIPIEDFKTIFTASEELIREKKIDKVIFDKRSLRVFHQPSMEWYFAIWKVKMMDFGVTTYVKLLPDDVVFCESVKIGRAQINKKYPEGRFHQLNITYADSMEEAVAT